MNNDDIYYKAMLTRDSRFDGLFFISVKTTGIYCHPICSAQPKRENIHFYPHAYAAEQAGYRPCLRCGPESTPQSAAWLGTSAIVKCALNAIQTNAYPDYQEDDFASHFGLSARHLRRLFQEEVGKTPKQVIDMQRINFARKLIVESQISLTQIAFLSGFGSVRRFNDAIKKRFARTPSALRKNRSRTKITNKQVTLNLAYRPPFPWHEIIKPFKSHEMYGIESISADHYERVITINRRLAHISIHNEADKQQLQLTVSADDLSHLYTIVSKVRLMFDIDSNPLVIEQVMQQRVTTRKLYKQCPGLRIPRAWDAFEMAICTILGQLVSIKRAKQLCQQLISHYGDKALHPVTQKSMHLFPSAEQILQGSLDELGTTNMRKQALKNFCRAILNEDLTLSPHQNYDDFIQQCINVKGIGPWTAEYIALRALDMTDAFPQDDLMIKRALEREQHIRPADYQPWRGYLSLYLWRSQQ